MTFYPNQAKKIGFWSVTVVEYSSTVIAIKNINVEKLQQPLLYMRKHSYTFPITEKERYMSSSGFLTTVSASVAHDPECEDMSTNKVLIQHTCQVYDNVVI